MSLNKQIYINKINLPINIIYLIKDFLFHNQYEYIIYNKKQIFNDIKNMIFSIKLCNINIYYNTWFIYYIKNKKYLISNCGEMCNICGNYLYIDEIYNVKKNTLKYIMCNCK